ncbi:MAG: hypothetical protein ACO1RA_04735 [Planctomycetaceae bacterium]
MIHSNCSDPLTTLAELAFIDACKKVIVEARATNTEIVICRDGKVVKLTPDEAEIELATNLAKREAAKKLGSGS